MSKLTGRLSEEDLRELARLVRGIHARAAAKRERERIAAQLAADDGGDQASDDGTV
jgi:hypothetical protein